MQVVLVGAGGHARVVLDAARAQGLNIVAVIDDDVSLHGTRIDGLSIVGGQEALGDLHRRGATGVVLGVGSIEPSPVRAQLYERIAALGFSLPVVCHPRAVVSPTAEIAAATVILAGAIVNPKARVGRNVIVNTASVIEHDCVVGDHAHISPGAMLAGSVQIGIGTHVGIGAVVIQGVRVGRDVLVAAGAVVVDDLSDHQRVAGIPARQMR